MNCDGEQPWMSSVPRGYAVVSKAAACSEVAHRRVDARQSLSVMIHWMVGEMSLLQHRSHVAKRAMLMPFGDTCQSHERQLPSCLQLVFVTTSICRAASLFDLIKHR